MLGLINTAIRCFARDMHGEAVWQATAAEAGLRVPRFEAMILYDDAVTERLVSALARRLRVPRGMLLEDMGTYLVSHPTTAPLRRLLRFGGETYADLVHSLADLPDRARLALPDLILPWIEVDEPAPGRFTVTCGPGLPGFGHALLGGLRGMADDYGVLATVELVSFGAEGAVLSVTVAEAEFAEARAFALAPFTDSPGMREAAE